VLFNALELREEAERVHLSSFLARLRVLTEAEAARNPNAKQLFSVLGQDDDDDDSGLASSSFGLGGGAEEAVVLEFSPVQHSSSYILVEDEEGEEEAEYPGPPPTPSSDPSSTCSSSYPFELLAFFNGGGQMPAADFECLLSLAADALEKEVGCSFESSCEAGPGAIYCVRCSFVFTNNYFCCLRFIICFLFFFVVGPFLLRTLMLKPTVATLEDPGQGGQWTVVGDLHGSLRDLSYILSSKRVLGWQESSSSSQGGPPSSGATFESNATMTPASTHPTSPPPVDPRPSSRHQSPLSDQNRLLFNGDYVDRGSHSVEVLATVLALKVYHPTEWVHVNRGNHEDEDLAFAYDFASEVILAIMHMRHCVWLSFISRRRFFIFY
jgi:hypothetical protein